MRAFKYNPLPVDEIKLPTAVDFKTSHKWLRPVLAILCALAIAVTGFQVGRATSKESNDAVLTLDTIRSTFQYNRSFSEAPNDSNALLWQEIFPPKGGFFTYTTEPPTRATFHVFHTLHCLNHIRHAYWMNHNAAVVGKKLTDDEISTDLQPSHVRHCIDLIRQSLICKADITMETVDKSAGGVHGFGTVHQCKDWNQLKDWVVVKQSKQSQ